MSSPRVGTTRGRGRGRKRSRRYTPPIPSDNDHSQSRERDQTPDASLSPTEHLANGEVIENLFKEIVSLKTLFTNNAIRERRLHGQLISENLQLRKTLNEINQKLTKLIDSSNSSIKTETLHVNQEDHQKNSTISGLTAILSGVPGIADESGASGLQDELEQIFSHANGASIPASNTDYSHPTSLLQQFGLCSPPKMTNGLNAEDGTTGNVFNTPTFYKRTRKEPSRTANSAPAGGNNDRKKPVARRGILLDYSGSDISPATIASSSQYARNRRYSSHNSTQGTQATDSPDYPSVPIYMMRQYIKPLPTTIPKPMTLRTTGRYGKPVMTEEWKEYALSIFPVKPSQHWDIRREDYDLLIPDPELHEAAKDPTGKAKNTLIRSIYDWFRVRHRIAQLKVVLSECDITMDNEELRAAYIEKMKEKKWPIYDRKLKNCEVRAARAQVFESYLDGTASQC